MAKTLNRRARAERMLEMWRAGKTQEEIAAEFGLTHQSVSYWLNRQPGYDGVHGRKDKRREQVLKLFHSGKCLAEISLMLKIAPSTVYGYLWNAGVSTRQCLPTSTRSDK